MNGTVIPAARYADRLERAVTALRESGAAVLLVGVGADLRWLTGYGALPLERLTMLVVVPGGPPTLIVPRLELAAAELAPAVASGVVPVRTWEETEDPFALVADAALTAVTVDAELLVSDRLAAVFLLRLQATFPGARFGLASRVLRELRMIKDAEEVELLRRAAQAADRALLGVAGGRLVGRSEREVAAAVRDRLVAEGHDLAAFAIVASGPNSASPHHASGERVIAPGDAVVLDIGGTLEGYYSDITRTLWVTGAEAANGPDEEFLRLYGCLRDTQADATRAVAPGIPCESVDAAARDLITRAGYGRSFLHRTGHGIGLEGHEEPYLVAGNHEPLREGHAFSVEPGIYLEGRYGARIEDIVVCGRHGPDVLNDAPRDLLVVRGA